jgi:hypothetical protein
LVSSEKSNLEKYKMSEQAASNVDFQEAVDVPEPDRVREEEQPSDSSLDQNSNNSNEEPTLVSPGPMLGFELRNH